MDSDDAGSVAPSVHPRFTIDVWLLTMYKASGLGRSVQSFNLNFGGLAEAVGSEGSTVEKADNFICLKEQKERPILSCLWCTSFLLFHIVRHGVDGERKGDHG